MARSNREYDEPHHPLERVHMAVALRRVVITKKAQREAYAVLPLGTIKVMDEIKDVVGNLERSQFRFSEERRGESADIYRVERYRVSIWVKIKLETDPGSGEEVVVFSFHEWDDTRSV